MDDVDVLLSEHGSDIELLWDYALMGHHLTEPGRARPVDAIVVPGGYDDRPAAYAAQVYLFLATRQNFRPLVITSGFASPPAMAQWGRSEAGQLAAVFDDVLRRKGEPRADISIEPDARNLGQNAQYVNRNLGWRGVQPQHLLIVCKPYLERRTFATFSLQGPGDGCLITMQSPPLRPEAWLRGLNPNISPRRSLATLVGDFERVAFPNGFLVPQLVPRPVWDAYVRLNDAGFSRPRAEGPGLGLPATLMEGPTPLRRTGLAKDLRTPTSALGGTGTQLSPSPAPQLSSTAAEAGHSTPRATTP